LSSRTWRSHSSLPQSQPDRLGVLDQAGTQPRREQVPSRQQPVGADRLLGAGHEIIHDRIGELAVLAGLLDAPA
jgi:hypothetical protein